VKAARTEWRCWRQPAMQREPQRLIFIDETSVKTNMTPLRGRCLRGQRLKAEAPFGKWHTPDLHRSLEMRWPHRSVGRGWSHERCGF